MGRTPQGYWGRLKRFYEIERFRLTKLEITTNNYFYIIMA